MFKVTRFKQLMLGLGLLAVREEANYIDNEAAFMPIGNVDSAMSFKMDHAPSSVQMENFLKEHGLKIDPAAFAVAKEEENNKVAAPLATPKAKTVSVVKSSQLNV